MFNLKKYESNDKMIDIIGDNYNLLQVMCRFGISLGFGDKTVDSVCKQNNVDCYTFLTVVNYMASDYTKIDEDMSRMSIPTLLKYLKSSHEYYLNFELPFIYDELEKALDSNDNLAKLILNFFREYMKEIRKHMLYEEKTVFPYVDTLLNNKKMPSYEIEVFSKHHGQADLKLNELKNVILKYLPSDNLRNNQLIATLYDIYTNEEWIRAHGLVEDNIFIPAIRQLEQEIKRNNTSNKYDNVLMGNNIDADEISEREKDVIVDVVKGMSNKEIADHLCISYTTVTTHRRNIARKLDIHSPAGLTIYAIVNKIVNIEDVAIRKKRSHDIFFKK